MCSPPPFSLQPQGVIGGPRGPWTKSEEAVPVACSLGVWCRATLVFEVELVGVKPQKMAGKGDTQSAHERLA